MQLTRVKQRIHSGGRNSTFSSHQIVGTVKLIKNIDEAVIYEAVIYDDAIYEAVIYKAVIYEAVIYEAVILNHMLKQY